MHLTLTLPIRSSWNKNARAKKFSLRPFELCAVQSACRHNRNIGGWCPSAVSGNMSGELWPSRESINHWNRQVKQIGKITIIGADTLYQQNQNKYSICDWIVIAKYAALLWSACAKCGGGAKVTIFKPGLRTERASLGMCRKKKLISPGSLGVFLSWDQKKYPYDPLAQNVEEQR